jgi:hypothetical protein
MSNRDDFPPSIRRAVAARAGWLCSFTTCQKPTVGPSEESSAAVTIIGKAAHICGASPGPGSRRYDPSMTSEERKRIENAIWLCADHADLVDKDEVTYTVEKLRAMKREHEALCARGLRLGKNQASEREPPPPTVHIAEAHFHNSPLAIGNNIQQTTTSNALSDAEAINVGAELLAIGPDIICTGDIANVSAATWTLRLKHFVVGDYHKLISFIGGFAKAAPEDKYVLSNEIGDGRVLSDTPSLTTQPYGYSLLCPVAPTFPRIDAQNLGTSWAMHSETDDSFLDGEGCIAQVSSLEALPQNVQTLLSMQRGESPLHPTFGIHFFEYFEAYRGSPWLGLLLKLDVVRQAAIPYTVAPNAPYTPLQCVTRVNSIELLSEKPKNNRLPVRVNFNVQGVGPWQRDLSIYMPTKEQMDEQVALRAQHVPILSHGLKATR